MHLQVGEQVRYALDLVENRALVVAREEAARIGLGELADIGRFEIGVGEVGECCPAERRLSGLPWTGDRDEWVLGEERLQARGDLAFDHARRTGRPLVNFKFQTSN